MNTVKKGQKSREIKKKPWKFGLNG